MVVRVSGVVRVRRAITVLMRMVVIMVVFVAMIVSMAMSVIVAQSERKTSACKIVRKGDESETKEQDRTKITIKKNKIDIARWLLT